MPAQNAVPAVLRLKGMLSFRLCAFACSSKSPPHRHIPFTIPCGASIHDHMVVAATPLWESICIQVTKAYSVKIFITYLLKYRITRFVVMERY